MIPDGLGRRQEQESCGIYLQMISDEDLTSKIHKLQTQHQKNPQTTQLKGG